MPDRTGVGEVCVLVLGEWTPLAAAVFVPDRRTNRLRLCARHAIRMCSLLTSVRRACLLTNYFLGVICAHTNDILFLFILVPRPRYIGDGILFSIDFFVYMYPSFLVSLLATLRENCWTNLHEMFREGVEWPWDDLITFWSIPINRAMPRCATRGRGLLCFSTIAC